MKNTFLCIKCKAQYSTDEDDAYLCDDCLIQKEAVAKSIDATHTTVGQQPAGLATQMEQIAREKGGYSEGVDSQGNKVSRVFVNVRDLGLI